MVNAAWHFVAKVDCTSVVLAIAYRHLQQCQLVTRQRGNLHTLSHPHDYTARRGGIRGVMLP